MRAVELAPMIRAVMVPLLVAFGPDNSHGQCPVTIAAFPYTEGFEASPAWTSGGAGSDWAWGAPDKAVINSAGGGANCWVLGGLAGSSYVDGQQSWLQGPCFNFSTLPDPWISFKIFWECERDYDGLALQYSLNAGGTWTNVGTFGAPANCLNANWYNTQFISNLNLAAPQQGWSGRIGPTVGICAGGSGSGAWVTASHCLGNLSGQSSVKFRFVFGAGTTCNSYDGVAIDDIFIGSAPPNQADLSFGCDGNTVSFTNTSALCPTGFLWNFGDPASGAANTSTLSDPTHTFPGPGTYAVSLTVTGPCNASSTITRNVSVLGLEFVTNEPGCGGGDGSIIALVSGTSVPLNVLWTPGGQTTVVLTGLDAGTYGVTVTAPDACPVQGSVELLAGSSALSVTTSATDISCNGADDGSISVEVQGGFAPLTYVWDPPIGTTATLGDLAPGLYTCTITDADGCSTTAQASILQPAQLTIQAPDAVGLCLGESTLLDAAITGGTGAYTVTWSPAGPFITPEQSEVYAVSVIDANGCEAGPAQVPVSISGPDEPSIVVAVPVGCAPHCLVLDGASAQEVTYSWDLGDGTTADGPLVPHCYAAGIFNVTLTVTDGAGCERSVTLNEAVAVQSAPIAAFEVSPPVTTLARPTVQFIDASSGAEFWIWSFGDAYDSVAFVPSPAYTFAEVDCYSVQLVVANDLGCADSTSVTVCVEDEFALYAPNAFSPNGDGINEVFNVVTTVAAPTTFELLLFNRWGEVLFATTDPYQGWNGDAAPSDVYVWRLRLRDTEGRIQERAGHVSLLR